MDDHASEPQASRLSVNILLPEPLDRRLARWAKAMPGASWPAWGGHITLLSSFVPTLPVADVLARVAAVGEQHAPFTVRLRAPVAIQDVTRPDYDAVFLTVDDEDEPDHHAVRALREDLLAALADVRTDVRRELQQQAFLPHITLALSLAKAEAETLVRAIRAEPLEAEFVVEVIWVLEQIAQAELESKTVRHPIGLGRTGVPHVHPTP
jgi:2'-5' RNA ligase